MPKQRGLGDLERQTMEFLWANGPAASETVRAVISRSAATKDRALAESTVRTVLRRLEDKGFVRREDVAGRYLYSGAESPRKVAAEAVRNAIRNFCRGSVEELLAGMVDHRVVSPAELRRLADKIEAYGKSETKTQKKGRLS
jgi:predicted transcriptional regulator